MNEKSPKSRHILQSDLKRVDAHEIAPSEYEALPELTDEMLARAVVKKGGRPHTADPRALVSFRLPESVLTRWRSSGPGWQTRMAEVLTRHAPDAQRTAV
jgi:uncharacterized protein (DUF4415 family)